MIGIWPIATTPRMRPLAASSSAACATPDTAPVASMTASASEKKKAPLPRKTASHRAVQPRVAQNPHGRPGRVGGGVGRATALRACGEGLGGATFRITLPRTP